MTKKEILDYITETPGNTNRAVLGDMLDSFEGGSGGADPFILRAVYDEEGIAISHYVSNYSIWDVPENTTAYIYEDALNGLLVPISVLPSGELMYSTINPANNPSVNVTLFTQDESDESGTIFNARKWSASLTFNEDSPH